MSLKKGEDVELEIVSAAYKGKGVAKHDGIAVFVPGTAPGDRVRARITRRKKSYREARLLEILSPSPDRIEPRCRHAFNCGGCNWQHLPYTTQLKVKHEQTQDHIERIAHLDPSIVMDTIGCDSDFYYRNKMEYSFGTRRWLTREQIESEEYVDDSGLAAGLHAPGRFDKILDLKECHLQDPVSYRILDAVRSHCLENNIDAYDTYTHTGFMRHVTVRNSHHMDDLMVNLVTSKENRDVIGGLCIHLQENFPQITTIVNNINDKTNPTAIGRVENVLYGTGFITDTIGGYTFRIRANAFFQTNTRQAEKLYTTAREFAGLQKEDILYDLYCGVGTLSLFMSRYVKKVVGIELSDVAVRSAVENAAGNKVYNTEFHKGDMKDTFNRELLAGAGRPDCIITDPPRAGMHPAVVEELKELRVSKLVYVSCNPSTLARDLKELNEVYEVEKVQPVDMFPQTYHIEAVAKLSLR